MSKTWREWGEERKLRSITKEQDNWKQEALEERRMTKKEDLYSVYVILNEWSPEDSGEDLSEIVHGRWYSSESEAWDDLNIIAESASVSLDREDTSFDVPERQALGLSHDTYYIQELTR